MRLTYRRRRSSSTMRSTRPAARRPALPTVEGLERRDLLSTVVGLETPAQVGPMATGGTPSSIASGKLSQPDATGQGSSEHYTYETLKAQLQAWEDHYGPAAADLVQLERIGDAVMNYNAKNDPGYDPNDPRDAESRRGLWVLKISDRAHLDEGLKEPDLKYIANMHGNEPLGMEMSMRFIEALLQGYGTDRRITSLVDDNEIYVLPMMNPDGFAHGWRGNANNYNLNRSFPELAPLDPYASTKPAFADLLAALPRDNRGNVAVPEVEAVMRWSARHQFVLAANFHTGALVVNYPYDNDGDGTTGSGEYVESPDDALYRRLATIYASNSPYMSASSPFVTDGVRGITNGAEWFEIDGGMQDFDYRYFGTKHVTVELYDGYDYGTNRVPIDLDEHWAYNREPMLAYLDQGIRLIEGQSGPASSPVVAGLSADPAALVPLAASDPVWLGQVEGVAADLLASWEPGRKRRRVV